MGKTKWYSGGNERAKQAANIITDLLDDLRKLEKTSRYKMY